MSGAFGPSDSSFGPAGGAGRPLAGRLALVTGGSRGIGRAVVEALTAEGATVLFTFKQAVTEARAVAGQTGATALQLDLADPAAVEHLAAEIQAEFGPVALLVNNGGHALEKLLLDTAIAEWDELMAVHLRAPYQLSRALLPGMIRLGWGRIVNIASIWGMVGAAGEVAYSAAKAGQIGLTKALAQEVGSHGITVNAVAPGAIATAMLSDLQGEDLDRWLERTPVGRLGTAAEVASVVAFLCRPEASFITGQVWSPNGGVVI
ncbi:MAG TPA: SDR family oxidoreductase [Symbiobacteriaceae bacterium]|nr:SDR family oxidoreductase [Symbiobacteriaceae bacterium]